MGTRSEDMAADVAALLRARNPLLVVVTREEARVEPYLFEAAAAAGYTARTWDVAQGVADMTGAPAGVGGQDPGDTLAEIRNRAAPSDRDRDRSKPERGVWILRDLAPWLGGPAGATTLRQVRNLARLLPGVERERAQALIIIGPGKDLPPELAGHATVLDWPLPDREEIGAMLDAAMEAQGDKVEPLNGRRDVAIDAAVGLTGEEAQACFSKSLVQLRKIDPAAIAREKKRVIARDGLLEWFDPLPGGLDAVGGLDALKSWLVARSAAYTPAARAYGLPAPKGAFLVGVPGCGKSLTAKAISTAWNVPLLRLDMGALKSKFVGESEANLRKAFDTIQAVGRCVVWLDEIEKAMQGATSGSADGGVSADALGAVLSWMQDRQGEAFVVATANDVEQLPPELLRKGRFDELWYVDLPNIEEREAVLNAALRTHKRLDDKVDAAAVAAETADFTGAEIAALVPEALFAAFADGARGLATTDLLAAAEATVPLAKTAAEKIKRLREWAKGRARPATRPTAEVAPVKRAARSGRALDI